MNQRPTPNERPDSWIDHLQNSIDRAIPSLTSAQSRAIAMRWDDIFIEAERESDDWLNDIDERDAEQHINDMELASEAWFDNRA